ncbi:MAG: hypothetical protein QM644_18485 [Mobilitalea sp.]
MWCNQIFSLIRKEHVEGKDINVVVNLVVCDNYDVANRISRETYGEDAFAIESTFLPISIGNSYNNGYFYDQDGKVIKNTSPSLEQNQIDDITLLIAQIIGG